MKVRVRDARRRTRSSRSATTDPASPPTKPRTSSSSSGAPTASRTRASGGAGLGLSIVARHRRRPRRNRRGRSPRRAKARRSASPSRACLRGRRRRQSIWTTSLPRWSPLKRRTRASGAWSMPTKMCSRCLMLPSATQAASWVGARGVGVPVVERVEPFHPRALAHEVLDVAQRWRRAFEVVGGDVAAQHDAAAIGEAPQHGVEQLATDVVEVDVDTARCELLEARRRRPRTCSRCRRRSPARRPPMRTSSAPPAMPMTRAPLELGDLARDGSDRARRRRNEERLTRFAAWPLR